MQNRISLFLKWYVNPEEFLELAEILKKDEYISLTVKTEQNIDVNILLVKRGNKNGNWRIEK
jgi:hypothetical protein